MLQHNMESLKVLALSVQAVKREVFGSVPPRSYASNTP